DSPSGPAARAAPRSTAPPARKPASTTPSSTRSPPRSRNGPRESRDRTVYRLTTCGVEPGEITRPKGTDVNLRSKMNENRGFLGLVDTVPFGSFEFADLESTS